MSFSYTLCPSCDTMLEFISGNHQEFIEALEKHKKSKTLKLSDRDVELLLGCVEYQKLQCDRDPIIKNFFDPGFVDELITLTKRLAQLNG